MDAEEITAELQKKMEKDKLFATLAMLSGDRVLAPYGKLMLEQVHEKEGYGYGGRVRKTSIGQGFILDPVTGEVVRDPGYAAYEKERDALEAQRDERVQQNILERYGRVEEQRRTRPSYGSVETEEGVASLQRNVEAPGGFHVGPSIPIRRPIPAEVRQKAAEANRLAQEANELYEELEKVRGTISSPKDIITDLIGHIPVIGDPISRATREGIFSPEQLSIQTRGKRFEQNLSNLASGLALTGYEIKFRDTWSPFAVGITQEETKRRLKNIQRDFAGKAETMLRANQLQPENVGTEEINFEDLP